jgi:hypothetical protein
MPNHDVKLGPGQRRGLADLRFVECLLVNLFLEGFWDCYSLQDFVLTEQQPVFERELGEREAEDELLPWKERPVEPASKALGHVRGTNTRAAYNF